MRVIILEVFWACKQKGHFAGTQLDVFRDSAGTQPNLQQWKSFGAKLEDSG
jgi:hypothetical protein